MHRKSRKLLRKMVREFRRDHSGLVSNLDKYSPSIVSLLDYSPRGMRREQFDELSVVDALHDLVATGHVREVTALTVSLTELGLAEGQKGVPTRAWDFINRSPALAILISLVSLLLSFVTFFLKS